MGSKGGWKMEFERAPKRVLGVFFQVNQSPNKPPITLHTPGASGIIAKSQPPKYFGADDLSPGARWAYVLADWLAPYVCLAMSVFDSCLSSTHVGLVKRFDCEQIQQVCSVSC